MQSSVNALCALFNGETDIRHGYTSAGGRSYVEVDCETGTMVYEGGLDKRSSLDSVQQALFFSHVTGKRPAVVIYDTDGREGWFEYRIRMACWKAGVRFGKCPTPLSAIYLLNNFIFNGLHKSSPIIFSRKLLLFSEKIPADINPQIINSNPVTKFSNIAALPPVKAS